MKKTKLKLLLIGLLCCIFQGNGQSEYERTWLPNSEKVRVISYNILDGFDGLKDTERIERMVEWIKEKDPEVMAFQELVGFKQNDLQKLAESYGHPYSVILKEEGYPVGITSKKPIQVVNKFVEGFWHGVLHVKTYEMDFIVIHLSPSEKDYRMEEAHKITTYISENCPKSCLVMGDFNSDSPFDADELETHNQYMMRIAAQTAANKNKISRNPTVNYSVQSIFLGIELEDVCRLFVKPDKRTTFPTRILTNTSKREDLHQLSGTRIDYIMVAPEILDLCVDAFIWNEEDTDYLSDHYPIGIDLFISGKDK